MMSVFVAWGIIFAFAMISLYCYTRSQDYTKFTYIDAGYPGDTRRPTEDSLWGSPYGRFSQDGMLRVEGKRVDVSYLHQAIIIGGGFASKGLRDQTKVYCEMINLDKYTWDDYDLTGRKVIIKNPANRRRPWLRQVVGISGPDQIRVILPDGSKGEYEVPRSDILGFVRYSIGTD